MRTPCFKGGSSTRAQGALEALAPAQSPHLLPWFPCPGDAEMKQACVGWGAHLWSGQVLEAGHTPDTPRRESQPGTLQAGCRPRLLLRGPSLALSSGESPQQEPCSPHTIQQLNGGWCSENLRGGERPGGGSHPTGTKRPELTCAPAGGSPASAGCAAPRWQPCPFPAPTLASPGRQPGEQDGGLRRPVNEAAQPYGHQ